jgi:HEAT repeat protein
MLPLEEVVEALGIVHLSRAAFWRLVAAGTDATPAVRRGLSSENSAVRRGCCEFLDLYWDDEAANEMLSLAADPDPAVRWMAAHALTCERCKRETWATRSR